MFNTHVLTSWLLSVLLSLSPLNKRVEPRDHEEGYAKELRLTTIAEDIVSVVYDEGEKPLFSGPEGLEKSAVFIAIWASHESGGFAKTVDDGSKRGDGGSSWCIMQLHIGKGKTPEGWTGRDLIEDRKKCIRAGYHVMKQSWNMCKGDPTEKLAAYISGRCDVSRTDSRIRYNHAMKVFKRNKLRSFVAANNDKLANFLSEN